MAEHLFLKKTDPAAAGRPASVWLTVLKKNYHQVLLVFAAFIVMVLAGHYFVRGILSNRLLTNSKDALGTAEANVRAAFAEAEISLLNVDNTILKMIEDGQSNGDILAYLKRTNSWLLENGSSLVGFYGLYGFIRGEFVDSLNFNPGPDYLPQTRPWYQAAARSGGAIAYTPPYTDIRTGKMIITVVKNITGAGGEIYGILALDIDASWVGEYTKNLRLAPGGYGMILSQYLTVMFHPDESVLGLQTHELGSSFDDIARRLREGMEVSGERIFSRDGNAVIAFFKPIYNGWYMGLLTPERSYYRDLVLAALILSLAGFVMALLLSCILLRVSAARMKADEESRAKSSFMANMSHEMRTPLNTIIGIGEIAQREGLFTATVDSVPRLLEYIGEMKDAGLNLLAQIDNILNVSQVKEEDVEQAALDLKSGTVVGGVVIGAFIAPRARVLVVDDLPTNLAVAEGLLAPYEMTVDACASGAEAVELVKERHYDLIFLDHMMPGMDGIETAARIRALSREVPIVALTANAVPGMEEMFLKKGFNDYFTKPINTAKLDAVILRWLPADKIEYADGAARPAPEKKDGESPERQNKPSGEQSSESTRKWPAKTTGKDRWSGVKPDLISMLFFATSLLVLLISVASAVVMDHTVRTVEITTQNYLFSAARAAAVLVTAEELDLFQTDEDITRPEWDAIKERLARFAEDHQVRYVYYWRDCRDGRRIRYIVDNDYDPESMSTPEYYVDLVNDPFFSTAVSQIMAGNSWVSNLGSYSPTWEGLISGGAPVFNSDGTVYCGAGVDLDDRIIINQRRNVTVLRIILLCSFVLTLISGSAGMLFYRRKARQSDEANKAKSQFLSTMSHEIRTPLNAIIGMGELALRADSMPKMVEHVRGIKQAGVTLLSLINDILDFSKIEAGRLEILPVSYNLASLVNDVVNIIKMRIGEKPIRLFVNVDPSLPSGLTGDEIRIRQIMLNLLGNGVKYTVKGFVGLTITGDWESPGKIKLRIAVSDSGIGIKTEDMGKLFGEFNQMDTSRNKGIEGTGLGLAITKRLCVSMGGDLAVKSVYGEGSVFTALIPQGVEARGPFAAVETPEQKPVLIYEQRLVYARSIAWALGKLSVPWKHAATGEEFTAALAESPWYYIFTGSRFHDFVTSRLAGMDEEKRPRLAVMLERSAEPRVPGVRSLSMPALSTSLADALNGVESAVVTFDSAEGSGGIKFTAPQARLLVVDDIAVNLQVASGLLAPYQTTIDTCLSGAEAVELIKTRSYDIVFMDHLMPEMDGIETTTAIRKWEKSRRVPDARTTNDAEGVPIIALTADAVSGMKEMFLSRGFNDYLSKPIDIQKLDDIMSRWLPVEKKVKTGGGEVSLPSAAAAASPAPAVDADTPPVIPGVNTAKGISMTGGTLAFYRKVLIMFHKDAGKRLPILQNPPEPDALLDFVTQVHALKSALGSIGAAETSARAAALEAAGKASDMAAIREGLPAFTQDLLSLMDGIQKAVIDKGQDGGARNAKEAAAPGAEQIPLARELAAALKAQKADEIERLLEEIGRQPINPQTREIVEQISDKVLMAEYGDALEIVNKLPGNSP
jgi:signal transduction histidine kinase/DNA-binding response OmpR family regulator/HPt (histidine-containing phosphotransfer) domain-containing protein